MSSTPLENASLEASYLKERRVNIVVRLLAEGLVVVLLMALGWWGMTTLGSDSLQAISDPIYVAGCPLADTTLEKGSAGGGCSKEGASHPMTSRQPEVGLGGQAHGAERHRDDRVPPRTSKNSPTQQRYDRKLWMGDFLKNVVYRPFEQSNGKPARQRRREGHTDAKDTSGQRGPRGTPPVRS